MHDHAYCMAPKWFKTLEVNWILFPPTCIFCAEVTEFYMGLKFCVKYMVVLWLICEWLKCIAFLLAFGLLFVMVQELSSFGLCLVL